MGPETNKKEKFGWMKMMIDDFSVLPNEQIQR